MAKPKLEKFTLSHNRKTNRWDLKNDRTNEVVKTFSKKTNATKKGVLKRAVGPEGASVKIQKMDRKFQEERTYPRSKDPKSSEG